MSLTKSKTVCGKCNRHPVIKWYILHASDRSYLHFWRCSQCLPSKRTVEELQMIVCDTLEQAQIELIKERL